LPDAESFRARWQSQLASLVGGTGSPGTESLDREQETAAGKPEAGDAAVQESAADEFQTTQTLAAQSQAAHAQATQALLAGLSLPLKQAKVPQAGTQQNGPQPGGLQQGAQAAVLTSWSAGGAQVASAAAQIGAPEPGREAANAATAGSADLKFRQTSRTHSSTHNAKSEKAATAAETKPADGSVAAAVIPALPMPLPIVPNAIANRAETKTLAAPTETVSSLSTAFTARSRNTAPSLTYRSAAEPLAANHENHVLHAPNQDMGTGTRTGQNSGLMGNALDAPAETGIAAAASTGNQAAGIPSPAAAPAQSPAHQDADHAQSRSLESRSLETQADPTSNNGQAAGQPLLTGQSPVSQPIPAPITAGTPANPSGTRPAAGPMQSGSAQSVKRNARESGSLGDRGTAAQGQLMPAAGDAAAMIRDVAGVRTAANPASGHAGEAAPALREAFAAMDAEAAPGAPTWLHAGARRAEAGFEDPALGWVGVRADMAGGGLHATLVPGSDTAAQELGLHMDGLNAYMAEQHTPIESLAMAAPEARGAGHGAEQSLSQGMGQGSNQGTNQGTNQGGNQGSGHHAQQQAYSGTESSSGLRVPGVGSSGLAGPTTLFSARSPVLSVAPSGTAPPSGGVHISVVA
jgi:hypothetical protein